MTIKEFKEILNEEDIPDDAEIIIKADHGQDYERTDGYMITRDNLKDCNDLEEIVFDYEGFENDYDEEALADYPLDGKVTGIVIFGY